MKKNFYLQHPLMAMNDPRMQHLIDMEGLKGIGAYWIIIEKLSLLPEPRADFEYLRPFFHKKTPFNYLKKIILEYGLFILEEDEFFLPAELNPIRNKEKKTAKIVAKNTGKTTQSNTILDENERKTAEKQQNTSDILPEKSSKNSSKPLLNAILVKNRGEKKEENIKDNNITTSSSLAERRKSAATTTDEFGNVQMLHRVIPWEESLKNLSEDSCCIDLAYLHCGYGALLKRRFKDAVEYFRRHIILYHKQDNLANEYEVYRYFANFTAAGGRTSGELRNYLLQLDEADRLKHPNIYRYEKLIDGKRTYNGCPLPSDAPPRPNDHCLWNDATRKWV